MIRRITFYLRYAARNLRRSARWTTFAVFCIAAGVATVVALRSLGLAIADSLVDNARAQNHGDITIVKSGAANTPFPQFGDRDTFTDSELDILETFTREWGGVITAYGRAGGLQVTAIDEVSVGRPQFVSALFVDPQTFPPTGDIVALDPAGAPLRDLLTQPNDIVISRNLADQQNLRVGDVVRVSNTTEQFTVRGIVPTEAEAGVSDLFASFFGFVYLDIAQADRLQFESQPSIVSIALPHGTDLERAEAEIRGRGIRGNIQTVDEILRRNATIGDYIGRFIVIMGLGALLIGGVGIINTMLVLVGRRTNEIAALKTFGLKGRQIAAIFLAEAFLLGVIGSLVGTALGIGMSGLVNQYGEAFLQQRLIWRLYPEAILYGLGLGTIVTLVFGILPVLTANRVRPATILRPNETVVPGVGCLHSLIALLLVIVVIGGVAGQILGNPLYGIIGVAATLLVLGILVCLLWAVVWVVSKFPAFGWVDLRLALRNLTSRRIRTATTLLALSAGMFALSSITFVGVGTREILQVQLAENLGGNVLVFPLLSTVSPQIGQGLLNAQLNQIEGIQYRSVISNYGARLVAINGEEPVVTIPFADQLPERAQRRFSRINLQAWDTDRPSLPLQLSEGRMFTEADRGQRVMIASRGSFATEEVSVDADGEVQVNSLPLRVGDKVTVTLDQRTVEFEIIGIVEDSGSFFSQGAYYVPPDSVPDSPDFVFTVLQVEPERLNQVLLDLSSVPLVFSLDITFIDGLLRRLIDQFSAIPTLVGLLSLLAAAVAMANTVSLATLERRRQIGILKAVGLKGRRVLWVMLLENTIVGLLGGLLGIGLSALGVGILTSLGQGEAIPIPREATPVAVGLIAASVLIAWAATFLSARPAANERVTNVLRYE